MTTTRYRHTKIIVTLGPSSLSGDNLVRLIDAGVDVCRLNMAHGDASWVRDTLSRVRAACSHTGRQIATLMDIKGPEIRTGVVDSPLTLARDDLLDLVTTPGASASDALLPDARCVTVNYPGLREDLHVGATVLVDSGLLHMEVLEIRDDRVRCVVRTPATLGSRRHINLPGVRVRLPALTDKDRHDALIGISEGIDFFALSFVREATDIAELRTFLTENGSDARIIAKIEDRCGLENIASIVQAADGVMIARGDLGIEIPFETLPIVQRDAVAACLTEGKPVIVATQLLESMIQSPMPTRAEITDISNAVYELADAVMLSGETAVGSYPLECVEVLKKVIHEIERSNVHDLNRLISLKTPKAKMLRSAAVLARELGGAGVVVFTRSGFLPHVLAALRAHGVPIYGFTDIPESFRHMLLLWGVEPFLMEFSEDPEQTIRSALAYLQRRGWCQRGDHVAVITNALAHDQVIDSLQLRQVE